MNMYIWANGTLSSLSIGGSYNHIEFSKKSEVVSGSFFVIGPLCTPHSICLNTDF